MSCILLSSCVAGVFLYIFSLDLQLQSSSYRSAVSLNYRHSWTARVLVSMGGEQFICSGVGHSTPDEAHRSKKKAVTNAYRQLFASLALVILHNGKVAVKVLP